MGAKGRKRNDRDHTHTHSCLDNETRPLVTAASLGKSCCRSVPTIMATPNCPGTRGDDRSESGSKNKKRKEERSRSRFAL